MHFEQKNTYQKLIFRIDQAKHEMTSCDNKIKMLSFCLWQYLIIQSLFDEKFVCFNYSFRETRKKCVKEKYNSFLSAGVYEDFHITKFFCKKRKNFSILKAQKKTLPLMTQLWSTTVFLNVLI